MTETFEGNGDFSYNDDESDYKRKGPHNGDNSNHDPNDGAQINDKANEYIRDCLAEKNRMDKKFPIAEKLVDGEIERVQTTGRIPSRDQKYADIYREKPLRVSQKVLVPIREHPKFNFVGKLLGPKGNSLRRLQEETLCKMTVLGRNSMRDRAKEEELRASMDPKYAHLNSDLHVEISTIAPPAEAYARIAYAMAELRKYLIPDSNDVIRQEQLRELMDSTGGTEHEPKPFKKPPQVSTGPPMSKPVTHHGYRQPPQPSFPKNSVAPKQKVMSILEKARSAMDESYSRGYEEQTPYEPQTYDNYSYGHPPTHGPPHAHAQSGRGPYEAPEYESEYRRDYYPHSPNYPGAGAAGPHTANANQAAGHGNNSAKTNATASVPSSAQSQQQPPNLNSTTNNESGNTNPKVQNNNRIQGPAAATNLLFVRPANHSLHVGKLPFLPVQFL